MAEEDDPHRIAHGQRVAGETRFETAPGQVARVRFTHPHTGPLPPDEQASEPAEPQEGKDAVSASDLTPSPSVWEAMDEDPSSNTP